MVECEVGFGKLSNSLLCVYKDIIGKLKRVAIYGKK